MKKKLRILILFFIFSVIHCQSKFELFPSGLNIQPFTANILEPRIGSLIQLGENELRLDIGNSIDIFSYSITEKEIFSFGADFFTWALLRSEKNFHFPVDAVDYLFGINFGYKKIFENLELGARFRISHISAHFVDGHYDNQSQEWRDDLRPQVYSREFLELIPYIRFENLRGYIGFTYLVHVDPTHIGKDNYQIGFEYFFEDFITEKITPFIGYDLKIINNTKYTGNNSLSIGIKIGHTNGRGISFYYNYYSGKNIHGEYYSQNKKMSSIGFNLDL
ncbi:MAG: DUF1207 domain-containing protein [Ignavibacteriales bacterium]|nr:DUF1207 domain-containing protein [Ignavibacteriales bacterium]